MRHIEQQSPGGVGQVHSVFTGEAEANVVLGKLQHSKLLEHLRFMFTDPEQLGKRKVRESWIAGECDKSVRSDGASYFRGFFGCALIAPY
jgi:hypothetical protein